MIEAALQALVALGDPFRVVLLDSRLQGMDTEPFARLIASDDRLAATSHVAGFDEAIALRSSGIAPRRSRSATSATAGPSGRSQRRCYRRVPP